MFFFLCKRQNNNMCNGATNLILYEVHKDRCHWWLQYCLFLLNRAMIHWFTCFLANERGYFKMIYRCPPVSILFLPLSWKRQWWCRFFCLLAVYNRFFIVFENLRFPDHRIRLVVALNGDWFMFYHRSEASWLLVTSTIGNNDDNVDFLPALFNF